MRTKRKILPTVCCIALLSACASNQKAVVAPLSIVPMVTMNSSDKPDAMYQMGRYYQGQNRFDQAVSAYLKVPGTDKNFAEARNGLGVVYSKHGKYREAVEAFEAAIQRSPKAAHIYSNLGYAYYLQGKYAESVAALTKATTLDPANQRAFNNLGLAYAKSGSKGESVQAFSQAVNVGEPSTAKPIVDTVAVASTLVSAAVVTSPNREAPAVQNVTVLNTEPQMLAIPKDSGVIRPASNVATVAQADSRVQLVKLAPNVFELRVRQHGDIKPIQMAAAVVEPTSLKASRVEVANGNGMTGMAGKVGKFLRNQGYPVARLTNQKPFQVRMTKIEYRDGYHAEAQFLQSSLPNSPELVQRDDLRADVSVRLVLGKDIVTHVAHFDGKWSKYQFARRLDVSDS